MKRGEGMLKSLRRSWIDWGAMAGMGQIQPGRAWPGWIWLAFCLLLAACGGGSYNPEKAPNLTDAQIETYNEGSEDTLFAKVTLAFDKTLKMKEGYTPKIRIANNNIQPEHIDTLAEGSSLTITIRLEKSSRDADLRLTLGETKQETVPEITDESGEYPAAAQVLEALLPSGVTLTETARGPGRVTVQVTHPFNIRSIAWVRLIDGEETVGASLLNGADERDGAVALHGHDFLTTDEYTVAADLAAVLTSHFGDRYAFTADGKEMTAVSLEETGGALELKIVQGPALPL
jgi:hypothetical protein